MNLKHFISLCLLIIAPGISAQKVFKVKYESQADIKVFVVEYESQADLKVYFVDYESQADEDGLWYFVKYESQAGWQKHEKQHLLL
ncbi:MAG: hypothetical protein KAR19_05790 [Bacteroidales bacterium]|nr:hypothetical protein [Bacteroidales bacterium]